MRRSAYGYFAGSAVFHYLGPAFAVLLFARIEPLGVSWLRSASAALILLVWRRPWSVWSRLDRATRWLLVAWGSVLAVMNAVFYLAIDRLPLGTTAAIEFLPVIVLAAIAVRSPRNVAAVILAVGGVYLLTDVVLVAEPLGLAFAAANALCFAAYIVLGHRAAWIRSGVPPSGAEAESLPVANRAAGLSGVDGLAIAVTVAAVVGLPVGLVQAFPAFTDPRLLLAGVGVGLCSSVIPYVCDQLAMARLPRGTYALLVCLLPATATIIGVVVLRQIPTPWELLGVALVIGGVALHRERVSADRVSVSV